MWEIREHDEWVLLDGNITHFSEDWPLALRAIILHIQYICEETLTTTFTISHEGTTIRWKPWIKVDLVIDDD